jgi:hypothetical protein
LLRKAKENGFSDVQLGEILDKSEKDIRAWRKELGINATFKQVDTCAQQNLRPIRRIFIRPMNPKMKRHFV